MAWAGDLLIVAGLSCVALLWVFSITAALHSLWDTFGEHAENLVERLKKKE